MARDPEKLGAAWDEAFAAGRVVGATTAVGLIGTMAEAGLLHCMQQGELSSEAWGGMPCRPFFEHRVIADSTHADDAHPIPSALIAKSPFNSSVSRSSTLDWHSADGTEHRMSLRRGQLVDSVPRRPTLAWCLA